VHGSLVRKATPTGTSVILVTLDGERTMNTFLGACRDFTASDSRTSPHVAIVNQTAAELFWRGESPKGTAASNAKAGSLPK